MKHQTIGIGEASRVSFGELEEYARIEIQRFLQRLLEEEVKDYFGRGRYERQEEGSEDKAKVVGYRNGYGKPRKLTTAMGTIGIRRPRVRDLAEGEVFESKVLPLFVRRTEGVDDALLDLYLHGLSEGDFDLAMRGLLGEDAPLSAGVLERLKLKWQQEYLVWSKRSLAQLEVVYLWVDGIYLKAGLEKEKACLLVTVAGLSDGRKVILGIYSGHRESKESWAELLRDLKERGVNSPKVVIGDGALGIWAALAEVYPQADQQRCWNHRMLNLMDKLPKKLQSEGKELLRTAMYADSRKQAEQAKTKFQTWCKTHQQEKAALAIDQDWQRLTTFFDYPKEHWLHLRTTNPVESPFDSVRLRTDAARRFKKTSNATAMLWKLLMVAETKSFRKLNAPHFLKEVFLGVTFSDGQKLNPQQPQQPQPLEVLA
jgi:transposase-like protein